MLHSALPFALLSTVCSELHPGLCHFDIMSHKFTLQTARQASDLAGDVSAAYAGSQWSLGYNDPTHCWPSCSPGWSPNLTSAAAELQKCDTLGQMLHEGQAQCAAWCRMDMGTADEFSLDMLINSFSNFSSE